MRSRRRRLFLKFRCSGLRLMTLVTQEVVVGQGAGDIVGRLARHMLGNALIVSALAKLDDVNR